MTITDWLQVIYLCLTAIGILFTGYVAVWVVKSLQKNLDDEHFIKEHFGKEIISVRNSYRTFLNNMIEGKMSTKEIKANLSRQIHYNEDLLSLLELLFDIKSQKLNEFAYKLQRLIEDDPNYSALFMGNQNFSPSRVLVDEVLNLEQDYIDIYNNILVDIYKH